MKEEITLNSLIKKYEEYTTNIIDNMSILNNMTEQNFQIYDKDIVRVWTKYGCYQKILNELKELKNEINKSLIIVPFSADDNSYNCFKRKIQELIGKEE